MYRFLIILFCLMSTTTAFAGKGSFSRFGVGLKTYDSKSWGDVKTLNFGYQDEFSGALSWFDYKLEVGGWVDNANNGRKSGGFAGSSIGVEPRVGVFYINAFFGAAAVFPTDAMLGSTFQFMEDIGLGVGDQRGVRVGVNYKHLSNAGLWLPNRGRDFFTVQVQLPW